MADPRSLYHMDENRKLIRYVVSWEAIQIKGTDRGIYVEEP